MQSYHTITMAFVCASACLLLSVLSGRSVACSCGGTSSPKAAFASSQGVFSGRVLSIEPDSTHDEYDVRVIVLASRIWKGVSRTRIIVYTTSQSTACAYTFEPDSVYLVYATSYRGYYATSSCSRTQLLTGAIPDLRYLATVGAGDPHPRTLQLLQNYPNPANPSTTFRMLIPEDSRVVFTLYGVTGGQVRTLFDGYRSEGTHELAVDLRDLASGIYICRLVTESGTVIRKLAVMK